MFRKILPGIVVMSMTLIWVGPFLVGNLFQYPLDEYAKSYRLYWLVFSSTLLISSAAVTVSRYVRLWDKPGYWGKFLVAWGFYTANIVLILVVFFGCASPETWEFFGSCPAGSFGMLFIPSTVAYLIGGTIIGLIYTLWKQVSHRTEWR